MLKKLVIISLALVSGAHATNLELDSISMRGSIKEVVVRSSTKETNDPWKLPSAMSLITPSVVQQRNITSIKDLSTLVPNMFIPDYGSRMTSAVYLRGVGTRSSGQSVGFYVDNIPLMDKSGFDFEMTDIQHIEVLRGPQGTLYGRNAMGGIINLYTLSPLSYQGTRAAMGVASYNGYSARVSHYAKLGDKVGLAVGAKGVAQGGYFPNRHTGLRTDTETSVGLNLKLEYKITSRLKAILTSSYDFTDQGAFPYGLYDKATGKVQEVNFNDHSSYIRHTSNTGLRFEYETPKVIFSSNTGYQYLKDNMNMDQDFTPASIFTINQRQKQNAVNQEFSIRSNTPSNYQWSVGAFGFYNHMTTNGDVTFGSDGIATILQPVFDRISASNPRAPKINITDKSIPNPGEYITPSLGFALFHQSTFNNIFTRGLSFTIGLRADFERQFLNYNTSIAVHIDPIQMGPPPTPAMDVLNTTMAGSLHQESIQVLPKVSLKYECSENIMTYITASKGHKSGGYNVQMFSEVIQSELNPMAKKANIDSVASYKPEITWNYEIGTRFNLWNHRVQGDVALFYMDIRDVQLTQFVEGGNGRILTNAGRARSCGVEVSLNVNAAQGLNFDLNYGYTNAIFTAYNGGTDRKGQKVDYTGNYIPYTPQHTFSIGATYGIDFDRWINHFSIGANYDGAGKIYWTESNDAVQKFYGLLNLKAAITHNQISLELWAKNVLNENYGAFYFESFGKAFVQRGRPMTFGANLIFEF